MPRLNPSARTRSRRQIHQVLTHGNGGRRVRGHDGDPRAATRDSRLPALWPVQAARDPTDRGPALVAMALTGARQERDHRGGGSPRQCWWRSIRHRRRTHDRRSGRGEEPRDGARRRDRVGEVAAGAPGARTRRAVRWRGQPRRFASADRSAIPALRRRRRACPPLSGCRSARSQAAQRQKRTGGRARSDRQAGDGVEPAKRPLPSQFDRGPEGAGVVTSRPCGAG